jgi:hypothetical protein
VAMGRASSLDGGEVSPRYGATRSTSRTGRIGGTARTASSTPGGEQQPEQATEHE